MIRLAPATVVLSTYRDGFLGIAIDADGGAEASAPALEPLFPLGFSARPLDPVTDEDGEPGQGCEALYGWYGSRGYVLPTSDPRTGPKLPELQSGECMVYGAAGQFIRCHADGSISLFTTDDATTDGRSIYFKMSPTKGFEWSCPWGRMTLGPNGFHVLHSSGARIDLGSIGGMPAPLDALASYAKVQAAMASVHASAVSLGTDGGATNQAANAALLALLNTLAAVVASMTPTSGVTAPQQAAFAAALTAFTPLSVNMGKVV